ncbi:MAG: hypothetical protein ABI298_04760 [Acidimicrobiales bacterium]
MVHGFVVTLLGTGLIALLVTSSRLASSSNTRASSTLLRVPISTRSAAHYAPIHKNSRSTRRERRNQYSTRINV